MLRKIILPIFAVILVAISTVGYIYGPALTGVFTAKTRYLIKPSPQKYGADALRVMESMGIYANSDEFKAAKKQAKEDLKQAKSYEDTYEILRTAIKVAGGKHSNVITPENNEPSTEENSEAPVVEKRGGVVYAKVPELGRGGYGQTYADTLSTGILDGPTCGAIVDLRGNGGGDMGPMLAGLSPLIPDGTVLEFVSPFGANPVKVEGNSVKGGGTPTTTSGGKLDVPVAVLVDDKTASSGEATMLAFRGLPNSQSFGAPTAGFASANVVIDLYDGAALMLTTAKDRARTGEEFNEDPIQPDVLSDDAEKEAMQWLAERQCS
ncbi:Peptidase family S41 [Corynebacterium kalinowskii]|uniref:Peptidase family S41 n=1 Tax=Corynebacterium kalinowskii TaxID=2675216 RepID=A0A6B8VQP7_9CORY|nr:S41 family peptidase [Corynebacterium kalinowskii]QGU01096.1 Peptidase family S41 [Corynebacterium kalinowskii]